MYKKISGFTLIELLIVVAIIAVLAAIAVPNFLEAQVRSKLSRVMNDMRTVGMAYTAYAVDTGKLPVVDQSKGYPTKNSTQYIGWIMVQGGTGHFVGKILTTPIAYISSIPMDPFMTSLSMKDDFFDKGQRGKTNQFSPVTSIIQYGLTAKQNQQFTDWFNEMKVLRGLFPKWLNWSMESCGPDLTWWQGAGAARHPNRFIYDPTNGSTSQGQIVYSSEGWISPARR